MPNYPVRVQSPKTRMAAWRAGGGAMGKRSDFKRKPRDYYPTPARAAVPLVAYLKRRGGLSTFIEPCCGDGRLAAHFDGVAACVGMSDIAPGCVGAEMFDALGPDVRRMANRTNADLIITNTPWPTARGEPALSFIRQFAAIRPLWLLYSADMAHNAYFAAVAPMCAVILSVGRVSWAENGVSGKENAAWYLFDVNHSGPTRFIGRAV